MTRKDNSPQSSPPAAEGSASSTFRCDVDLGGRLCPYPVTRIIYESEQMKPGETRTYLVDDPLAIKSVPEELEDYADHAVSIESEGRMWRITVTRRA